MKVAMFPGKFQPPHLGHILTIMRMYSEYDIINVVITDDGPHFMPLEERKLIMDLAFRYLQKVRIYTYEGILTKNIDFSKLPTFDICVSGNEDVLDKMKKTGKEIRYISRSNGKDYSGTFIREAMKHNE